MLSTIDFFWLSGVIFMGIIFLVWFSKPPFMAQGGVVVGD
jgi:DHA2 family multidrug resistance protein